MHELTRLHEPTFVGLDENATSQPPPAPPEVHISPEQPTSEQAPSDVADLPPIVAVDAHESPGLQATPNTDTDTLFVSNADTAPDQYTATVHVQTDPALNEHSPDSDSGQSSIIAPERLDAAGPDLSTSGQPVKPSESDHSEASGLPLLETRQSPAEEIDQPPSAGTTGTGDKPPTDLPPAPPEASEPPEEGEDRLRVEAYIINLIEKDSNRDSDDIQQILATLGEEATPKTDALSADDYDTVSVSTDEPPEDSPPDPRDAVAEPPDNESNDQATIDGATKQQYADVTSVSERSRYEQLADDVYGRFAARFETDEDTVHRGQFCGLIAPAFRDALENDGQGAAERIRRFPDGRIHRFVETDDGVTIVDPTWQQFVSPDRLNPDLPKVLMGTKAEIRQFLEEVGLYEEIGGIWLGDPQQDVTLPEVGEDEDWGWHGANPESIEKHPAGSLSTPPYDNHEVGADSIEVQTYGLREVAINRAGHPDQGLVDQLVEVVRDSPPDAWHELERTTYIVRSYLTDLDPNNPEEGNPTYFAKINYLPDVIDPEDAWQYPQGGQSEIRISQMVDNVVNTHEAQEIARAHGFAEITFVRPLVTVTDASLRTIERYFRWQEGQVLEDAATFYDRTPAPPGSELDALNSVVDEIAELFRRNGIAPHDFSPSQVILSRDAEGNRRLHIIDVESFREEVDSTGLSADMPRESQARAEAQFRAGYLDRILPSIMAKHPDLDSNQIMEIANREVDVEIYLGESTAGSPLRSGEFVEIPTRSSERTTFTKTGSDFAEATDRTSSEYIQNLFPDDIGSDPVAGGEAGALGEGKAVLDLGSGQAVALLELSKKHQDTTFIGIDANYDVAREVDVARPGVQLTKDSWETLENISPGSIDTIISSRGIHPWGMGPDKPESSERIADAVTRVAKEGAVWRFDITPGTPETTEFVTDLLIKKGWDVTRLTDPTSERTFVIVAIKQSYI